MQSRLKRIAVPLIFGILVLSPPQVYLERLSHQQFSGSLIEFLPHYFEGWYAFGGNFAWMGLHLWYLLLLLEFSFAGLPIFYEFRKRLPQGIEATPLFLIVCLLVLPLPGTFLNPDGIPGSRIWGGWSMVEHFVIFMKGFVLFSWDKFPIMLEQWRYVFLVTAIALSLVVMIPNPVNGLSFGGPGYFLKMLVRATHCLSCVFAILGLAHQHLNSGGATLKKLNEAVLPFNILHQAVIVPVGFFVVSTGWMMGLKYLAIAVTSFAIILLLYALVRSSYTLRFVFGMSSQKHETPASPKGKTAELELVK